MTTPAAPETPDAATTAAEMRIVRDLLLAWALDRAGIPLKELARALLERDIEAAMDLMGLERMQNALASLQAQLDLEREAGWERVAAALPAALRRATSLQLSLRAVELQNPAVQRLAQQLDLSRITAITADSREALRALLAQGWQDGTHPNVLARQLRDAVGVNNPQAVALSNYRARLIAQGRDSAQIDRMVAKKAQQYRTVRARTIARTELARAQQEGARAQYQRLVDDGIIAADEWVVSFLTAEDERVCPICGPIDGQYVPIGGMFVTAVGLVLGPPLHPSCRCVTRLLPKKAPGPLPNLRIPNPTT